jgi:hypothetical protein
VQLARRVVARRRWQTGAAIGIAGWPLQAAALLLAPLVVVQPTLAVGLVVMLVAARRVLGERPRGVDVAAVIAIALSVGAIVAVAPARQALPRGPAGTVFLVALCVAALIPLLGSRRFAARGRANAVAAGAAYAAAGIATKHMTDALGARHVPTAAVWLAIVCAASAAGTLLEMVAYRVAAVAAAAPLVFVLEFSAPTALGFAGGERPSGAGGTAVLLTAAALIVTAAGILARSPAVDALIGQAHDA